MPQYKKKTPPTPTTSATPTTMKRFAFSSRRKSKVSQSSAKAAIGIANAPSRRNAKTPTARPTVREGSARVPEGGGSGSVDVVIQTHPPLIEVGAANRGSGRNRPLPLDHPRSDD